MRGRNERGEGRLSTFIWLAVIAAGIYAGWHVIPIYIDNYTYKDKMLELCRLPRGTHNDDRVLDMLVKEAREAGLADYISRRDFRIQTGDTSRRIYMEYEREGEVLPGWKHVFHFVNDVSQPLLF